MSIFKSLLSIGALCSVALAGTISSATAQTPGDLFKPLDRVLVGGDFGEPFDYRGRVYVEGRFRTLSRLIVKYGAINIEDPDVLDEFSTIEYCNVFLEHYENDFNWKKIRPEIQKNIDKNKSKWPTGLYIDGEVKLERYDFVNKGFRLHEKASIDNLGIFNLMNGSVRHCYVGFIPEYFPIRYKFQLEDPVSVPLVKVSEERGRAVLEKMIADGNRSRVVPVRFLVNAKHGQLSGLLANRNVTGEFFGELEAAIFYTDETREEVLYEYRPVSQKPPAQ